MDRLLLKQIAKFAGAEIEQGNANLEFHRVSTDSRTIKKGELFVPLPGEKFDGHAFIAQALERGAAGAIISKQVPMQLPAEFGILRVIDTLSAYQKLAANYRKTLKLKAIAITGSNGKTSTKDFLASILGRTHRVTRTEGNFNNHVGVPRTILEADHSHQFAVWELGMNHPHEIALLSRIATPNAAIITNVGVAHIEFMGSRDAIAREKGALAEAIPASGFVVLNADDPFSRSIGGRTNAHIILAGIDSGDLRAMDLQQTAGGTEFTIVEGANRCRSKLPVPGLHMVRNAVLAVAAARAFGVALEDCATGLAATSLTKGRLQIREVRGVHFIDDSYNANPDSVKAALRTLRELSAGGKRIAVLGRMLELGHESERGHREVGREAATLGIDHLIAIGDDAIARAALEQGLRSSQLAKDAAEAAAMLSEIVSPGDLVLVKGSRSVRTELVIEHFENRGAVRRNGR